MSERRQALLGRFRAASLDRVQRLTLALIELEGAHGRPQEAREVARELHTLKGEARMLGLEAISDVTHRAEGLLLGSAPEGERPPPAVCARLIAALDVVARALRGELGGEEQAGRELAEAGRRLDGREAAAAAEASPAVEQPQVPAAERWIQVRAEQVDELSERVAGFSVELRALRARMHACRSVERAQLEDLDRCAAHLDDLVGASWALRLVPIEPLLGELVRHARDLALAQGKRLRVVAQAAGAQVERSVLDELREPLLHLVRNAVDHGVEPPERRGDKGAEACLTLRAEPVGAGVVITVADDGQGIDPEGVRRAAVARGLVAAEVGAGLGRAELMELVFQHGFSTRDRVSELSGRGVGLDVVRRVAERLGGSVALDAEPGRGSRFTLTIPARVSQERVMVVACGGALYGLPSRQVVEVVGRPAASDLSADGRVLQHRGEAIPLRSLSATLAEAPEEEPFVLVLASGSRRWAFGAPSLVGEYDLVRRPVDRLLAAVEHVGASATLDDGRLVLLVALGGLLRRAELVQSAVAPALPAPRPVRALMIDDAPVLRRVVAGARP